MPPVIDSKKCKKCGRCADICQSDVFFGSLKGKVPVILYPEECWHCKACVDVSPSKGAIRLRIPLPLMVTHK